MPPPAETHRTVAFAPAPKQLEAPAKPAPPAAQQPQRMTGPRPLPTATTKGAAQLIVPSAPAPARVREPAAFKTEPIQVRARGLEESAVETGLPVRELVVKGASPEVRPRMSVTKVLKGIGLVLGVGALGIVIRLARINRSTAIAVPNGKKAELRPAPGLLMKEPVNLPREPVVADRP